MIAVALARQNSDLVKIADFMGAYLLEPHHLSTLIDVIMERRRVKNVQSADWDVARRVIRELAKHPAPARPSRRPANGQLRLF